MLLSHSRPLSVIFLVELCYYQENQEAICGEQREYYQQNQDEVGNIIMFQSR